MWLEIKWHSSAVIACFSAWCAGFGFGIHPVIGLVFAALALKLFRVYLQLSDQLLATLTGDAARAHTTAPS